MIPAASASAWRARASASSSSSGAARVASVVTAIPPASYGAPAIRAANSSARSPAKIRWVWLSTKPGITQRPPASRCSSRVGAGALDRDHRLVLDHERRVAHDPERPLAELGIVRDQEPDVVDRQRAHPRHRRDRFAQLARRRRARGGRRRGRSRDRRRSPGRRRRRRRAKTTDSSAVSAVVPASRTPSSRTVTRSAAAPGSSRPASGQPSAACPLAVAAPSSVAAPRRPRSPLARRSSSSIARASSNWSITACESDPSASDAPASIERPGRADPVGEVALGGRAETAVAAALAEQRDVGAGQVGGVDRGEPRAERAGPLEHRDRRLAVGIEAGRVLGRLLGDVRVERAPVLRGPGGDRRGRARVDRAHAVDRGADPDPVAVGERVDPLGPGLGVARRRSGAGPRSAARRSRRAGSRCRAA